MELVFEIHTKILTTESTFIEIKAVFNENEKTKNQKKTTISEKYIIIHIRDLFVSLILRQLISNLIFFIYTNKYLVLKVFLEQGRHFESPL